MHRIRVRTLAPLLAIALAPAFAGSRIDRPDAIVDLRTEDGLRAVRAEWRTADAHPSEIDSKGPGADLRASGRPVRTLDIGPKAGAIDFDDSSWEVLPASATERRLSNGRFAFTWYRIGITIPERVLAFDTAGSTVVFELVVDDYAEVWVDGRLPRVLGQRGGPLVAGFNAPNRVVIGRDVRPGQRIQLAVFAANAPLSDPPANFIWIRSATLDFYRPEHAPGRPVPVETQILRADPALDAIVPPGTRIERLADGFSFTEGPVWHPDGYLLFSDPNDNVIWRWTEDGDVSVYRTKSGYTGGDIAEYGQPGSNGLALDPEGRLTVCEHGNRRITRLEKTGVVTVLADRYLGKRLNSPNDLVYRSDGALFFTDPPFGLPAFHEDPRRELEETGVYSLFRGVLHLVSSELRGPNGVAFTPDEKRLYVSNWDPERKVLMRYDVAEDATLSNGTVFYDMGGAPGEEALDGVEVDRVGNVFVSGPGGMWILSPTGKHLGTIRGPELAANFAWGGDGRTLYMTARTGLYRIRLR